MSEDAITAIIATDGSAYSLKAAKQASALLSAGLIQSVTVLYVAETTKDLSILTNLKDALTEEGQAVIDRTIAEMPCKEGVVSEILFGEPADAICEYARSRQADLIILGVKGRSAVMDIVMGSVCSAVTHEAPCSVLLIRNPQKEVHEIKVDPNSESIA